MKKLLKAVPFVTSSVRGIRRLLGITPDILSIRKQDSISPEIIRKYFAGTEIYKLHIGCQDHPLDGWLNADIYPKQSQVIYLDATKTFPFADNTFSYIFSEHMIEHISFQDGFQMIMECYRILKPGGKIRIATPDLAFLMNLYAKPEEELHKSYTTFSKRYFPDNHPVMTGRVVNNFFRDWGHKYIHDKQSLAYLLEHAGFLEIHFSEVGESSDPPFKNLEKHGKEITETFNRLETLVAQALKK